MQNTLASSSKNKKPSDAQAKATGSIITNPSSKPVRDKADLRINYIFHFRNADSANKTFSLLS